MLINAFIISFKVVVIAVIISLILSIVGAYILIEKKNKA